MIQVDVQITKKLKTKIENIEVLFKQVDTSFTDAKNKHKAYFELYQPHLDFQFSAVILNGATKITESLYKEWGLSNLTLISFGKTLHNPKNIYYDDIAPKTIIDSITTIRKSRSFDPTKQSISKFQEEISKSIDELTQNFIELWGPKKTLADPPTIVQLNPKLEELEKKLGNLLSSISKEIIFFEQLFDAYFIECLEVIIEIYPLTKKQRPEISEYATSFFTQLVSTEFNANIYEKLNLQHRQLINRLALANFSFLKPLIFKLNLRIASQHGFNYRIINKSWTLLDEFFEGMYLYLLNPDCQSIRTKYPQIEDFPLTECFNGTFPDNNITSVDELRDMFKTDSVWGIIASRIYEEMSVGLLPYLRTINQDPSVGFSLIDPLLRIVAEYATTPITDYLAQSYQNTRINWLQDFCRRHYKASRAEKFLGAQLPLNGCSNGSDEKARAETQEIEATHSDIAATDLASLSAAQETSLTSSSTPQFSLRKSSDTPLRDIASGPNIGGPTRSESSTAMPTKPD